MNIDEMSDEEVDAFLAAHDEASSRQPGGDYGAVLAVCGAAGAFASAQLLLAELHFAAHPDERLTCDVSERFGCSTFLGSWEGHLLGPPNALFGLAFFSGLLALGLAYLLGGRPRLEPILGAGAAGAFVAIGYFAYLSLSASTLCPWCLVAWAATIPFIAHTAARVIPGARKARWWLTLVGYLITAIIAGIIILG